MRRYHKKLLKSIHVWPYYCHYDHREEFKIILQPAELEEGEKEDCEEGARVPYEGTAAQVGDQRAREDLSCRVDRHESSSSLAGRAIYDSDCAE